MLWPSRITAVQGVASGLTPVRISSVPLLLTLGQGGWSEVVRGGDRAELGKRTEGTWRGRDRAKQQYWQSEGNYFWDHITRTVY